MRPWSNPCARKGVIPSFKNDPACETKVCRDFSINVSRSQLNIDENGGFFEKHLNLGWFARWSSIVVRFGTAQFAIQAITSVTGLLIARNMDLHEYAIYSIIFQMQFAIFYLADSGLGVGLKALASRDHESPERLGSLLSTTMNLRFWFFMVAIIPCCPLVVWILKQNGVDWTTSLMLCVLMALGSLWSQSAALFSIIPWLHGQYKFVLTRDCLVTLFRLGMVLILLVTKLNALTLTLVSGLAFYLTAISTRNKFFEYATKQSAVNSSDRGVLLSYARRGFPNSLFVCLQGQIAIYIFTSFGQTDSIAEISAIGRITVLSGIVTHAIGAVLTPKFAICRTHKKSVSLYKSILGVSLLSFMPFIVISYLSPGAFLMLLGTHYATLGEELTMAMLVFSASQISVVMWSLNSSRGWINSHSFFLIPSTLVLQILFASMIDLSTIRGVLLIQLVQPVVAMILMSIDAYHAFHKHDLETLTS